MTIKVGDRVKFMSDTRTGVVKRISHGLAEVDVEGFPIPVSVSELVAVDEKEEKRAFRAMGGEEKEEVRGHRGDKKNEPRKVREYNAPHYGKISLDSDWEDEPVELPKRRTQSLSEQAETFYSQFSQKQNETREQESVQEEVPYDVTECKVKLLFVPNEPNRLPEKSDLDMYLVNDSSYRLYYSIAHWQGNDYVETVSRGEMENDTKIHLKTIPRNQLNEITHLQVSVLPFKRGKYIPVEGIDGKLELHPLKFVKSKNYVENDYFDELSVEFTLIDSK